MLKIAPICLFGVDFANFEYGYVAGFGSNNFATNCWTGKDGPNPFEQCQPEFESEGKKYNVRFAFKWKLFGRKIALPERVRERQGPSG